MEISLRICALTKRFSEASFHIFPHRKNDHIVACDNIHLEIKKGELLALIGPNGSGKTTLIKILLGLITPDSGTAFVCQYDICNDEIRARSMCGFILSEEKNFYPRLTGRENLKFFARFNGLSSKEASVRIACTAKLLEIEGDLDRVFEVYSAGLRQRINIARGLLTDAPVLLFDEPTKNLDPLIAEKFRTYVKEKLIDEEKKAILWTSHQLSELAQMAAKVAIIEGLPTAFNGQQRRLGFEEAMKTAGLPIVSVQSGQWEIDKANTVASAMLSEHPDLQALLCGNDSMALGAVAAVQAAGRTGKVLVAGYDGIAAIRPMVADGRVTATADQHADQLAVFGIEAALKILKGESPPADQTTVVDLVTR